MISLDNKKTKVSLIPANLLLAAYSTGYFPMADPDDNKIYWYSPDPRAIIPLDEFKISRSLKQVIKKKFFEIKINIAFRQVIEACADRKETWISQEIIESYLNLHKLGYAHSVETWYKDELVGGLYGVALGSAFFGESMFSRKKDASKVALVALVDILKQNNFVLLDTQYITPHLRRFGAIQITRDEYLKVLSEAIRKWNKFP